MEKEFDEFWTAHRQQLIAAAPRRLAEERAHSLGMNTMGDWLLWIVPVGITVTLMDYQLVESRLLNMLVLLVICVACVVLCLIVKPYVTGKRSVVDIDEEIKQYYYDRYKRGEPLESLLS